MKTETRKEKLTQYIYNLEDTLDAVTSPEEWDKTKVVDFICALRQEALLKYGKSTNAPLRIRCNGKFKYDETNG